MSGVLVVMVRLLRRVNLGVRILYSLIVSSAVWIVFMVPCNCVEHVTHLLFPPRPRASACPRMPMVPAVPDGIRRAPHSFVSPATNELTVSCVVVQLLGPPIIMVNDNVFLPAWDIPLVTDAIALRSLAPMCSRLVMVLLAH